MSEENFESQNPKVTWTTAWDEKECFTCDACAESTCETCGHEPCPVCGDDCDHIDCLDDDKQEDGSIGLKKNHACVFRPCPLHVPN